MILLNKRGYASLLNVNHVMNQYAVLIVMSHLLIIKLKIDSNVICVNILFLHLVLVQTVEVRILKRLVMEHRK